MSVAQAPVEQAAVDQRIVLNGVSWDFYQRMLREIGTHAVRFTYDRGRLEIMTLSQIHEIIRKIIGRLLEAYGDETGVAVEGLGSTTFTRADLKKGLEPDECYYIANAAHVIGKEKLDLTIDPAPDLAIEVEISRPMVRRQPIYAALGVGEIWRFDGGQIHFLLRQEESGAYAEVERSPTFPGLPREKLDELIQLGLTAGQTEAVRALRQWLKS